MTMSISRVPENISFKMCPHTRSPRCLLSLFFILAVIAGLLAPAYI
jgi:hypothetical protein